MSKKCRNPFIFPSVFGLSLVGFPPDGITSKPKSENARQRPSRVREKTKEDMKEMAMFAVMECAADPDFDADETV